MLGIVAGDKNLPYEVMRRVNEQFVIAGVEGAFVGEGEKFPISHISRMIKYLRARGVDRVVIVGGVHNARIGFSLKLVEFAVRLFFMKNRYDGVLRLVINEFEKNGIEVVGAQEVVPSLLVEKGALGLRKPSVADLDSVKKALAAARDFAATDKGQSAAISADSGDVLALEKWAGTGELLQRAGAFGGAKILVKLAKPNQDMRADAPTIGEATVQALHDNGFVGAAVEAGKTIIENREVTVRLADKLGIWIDGISFSCE